MTRTAAHRRGLVADLCGMAAQAAGAIVGGARLVGDVAVVAGGVLRDAMQSGALLRGMARRARRRLR